MALPSTSQTIEQGQGGLTLVASFGLNTLKASNLAGFLVDTSGNVTAPGTLAVTGATTFTGNQIVTGTIVSTTTIRTGSGAIDVTSLVTKVNTTGGGTLTLADGVDGQLKIIVLDVDSGTDAVITPTTKTGFTTITMGDAGDAVQLVFVTTRGWICTANQGCALA